MKQYFMSSYPKNERTEKLAKNPLLVGILQSCTNIFIGRFKADTSSKTTFRNIKILEDNIIAI
jgi:hypothetical protein